MKDCKHLGKFFTDTELPNAPKVFQVVEYESIGGRSYSQVNVWYRFTSGDWNYLPETEFEQYINCDDVSEICEHEFQQIELLQKMKLHCN